jgi:hypothetical protein
MKHRRAKERNQARALHRVVIVPSPRARVARAPTRRAQVATQPSQRARVARKPSRQVRAESPRLKARPVLRLSARRDPASKLVRARLNRAQHQRPPTNKNNATSFRFGSLTKTSEAAEGYDLLRLLAYIDNQSVRTEFCSVALSTVAVSRAKNRAPKNQKTPASTIVPETARKPAFIFQRSRIAPINGGEIASPSA